jgi:hypothetical protein
MQNGLTRVVDGVEERLCWRFGTHGRGEATYQPSDGQLGPFDRDRLRRLRRGETLQRLSRTGSPLTYEGLSWQPKSSLVERDP